MVRVTIEFEESIVDGQKQLDVNVREVAKEENPTILERACVLAIRSFITSNIPCPTTFIDAAYQIERNSDQYRKQLGLDDNGQQCKTCKGKGKQTNTIIH